MKVFTSVLLVGVLCPSLVNASVLWGLGSETNALYQIDPTTGVATFATNITGGDPLAGAGLEWLDGQLWASNLLVPSVAGPQRAVGRIDSVTGVFTPVLSQGQYLLAPLAADASAKLLYSVAQDTLSNDSFLVSMTTTGVMTFISGPFFHRPSGMAFDNLHGILYAAQGTPHTEPRVWMVDTTTGHFDPLFGPSVLHPGDFGLAFDDSTGTLYANDDIKNSLYLVNTTNGDFTLVGNNLVQGITGLAVDPTTNAAPEPASLLLFGGGLAGAAYRHRLKRRQAAR